MTLATTDPKSALAKGGAPAHVARLPWVDQARTVLTFLVVSIHATIVYSHVGSWYFMHPVEPGLPTKIGFLVWEGHLQSFFMGLFFFLSGYFAHFSLQRRGPGGFVRERLFRLGIPLAFFVCVVQPFILFVLHPWSATGPDDLGAAWLRYFTSGQFVGGTGPLWFVETLLLFSLAFAAWRAARPVGDPGRPIRFTGWHALGLGASLAVITFAVRLVQPFGTSIANLQLCFFTQYVAAFALGVRVARRWDLDALASIPWAVPVALVAVLMGPILQLGAVWLSLPIAPGAEPAFAGGWNLAAMAYALWEQCAGVFLSLGLMALLRARANRPTKVWTWLSDRSFAVYVLHAPVLIGLTMLLNRYYGNPFVFAVALSTLAIAASYLVADLVRRIPGVKAVL
ncbi:hypothetical protein DB347_11445 [Opitutaceae bacterium EW11]|nr:hypothetical protein DB347_11445 [Opitutaceae bacterium EW11]